MCRIRYIEEGKKLNLISLVVGMTPQITLHSCAMPMYSLFDILSERKKVVLEEEKKLIEKLGRSVRFLDWKFGVTIVIFIRGNTLFGFEVFDFVQT